MEEKKILEMAEKGSNWQEVIEFIITEEGMDPWDIDLVKLADAFAEYVKKV